MNVDAKGKRKMFTLSCKKLALIMYGWCMSRNCFMKTIKTFSRRLTNRIDAKNQKKTGWIIYNLESEDVLKMICRPLTELQEASVERSWE